MNPELDDGWGFFVGTLGCLIVLVVFVVVCCGGSGSTDEEIEAGTAP